MATTAKYAAETLWAIASKGAAFVFYYGLVYYLTRRMPVTEWGNWSAFYAILNILLLVSDQGINTASKRYIALARDSAELPGVIRITFILRVVASIGYTAVIALLIPLLLTWLGQRDYIRLMQRSLVLIAIYGMVEYFKYVFEALHHLRFTFVVNALEHGCKLLFVVILFRGDTFVPIITAFTLAIAVAFLAGLIATHRIIPGVASALAPKGRLRQTYAYSLPVFLMSIGGFIALEIDTVMLKYLRSAYEAGIYSAAKNIVLFLPHISLAVSMGVIPGIAVFDADNAQQQRRVYYRILGGVIAVYLLVCLAVLAFALFGMRFFFATEYHAASAPLLALIPFVVLSGLSNYTAYLLDYRGFAGLRAVNFTLTIVANIALNWWWIPRWGALGAALASSIAFVPYCLLNLWQAHRVFRIGRERVDT